jgi:hypothetical protein
VTFSTTRKLTPILWLISSSVCCNGCAPRLGFHGRLHFGKCPVGILTVFSSFGAEWNRVHCYWAHNWLNVPAPDRESVECFAKETEVPGKTYPQCRFVHHKSHITWPRLEPGPPASLTGCLLSWQTDMAQFSPVPLALLNLANCVFLTKFENNDENACPCFRKYVWVHVTNGYVCTCALQ